MMSSSCQVVFLTDYEVKLYTQLKIWGSVLSLLFYIRVQQRFHIRCFRNSCNLLYEMHKKCATYKNEENFVCENCAVAVIII